MERVKKLCSYLSPCRSFADIGCDHGYCTEYMLKNGLCQTAVVSDISAKSLQKAQTLLQEYIRSGRCEAVCCDGLEKIDPRTELVLIAGMGGEEIVKILKNSFIPQNFLFQPMKNAEKLREYLLACGCELTADDLFYADNKYYFIIKGKRAGKERRYSQAELRFGRHGLKNGLLKNMLAEEISKKQSYLTAEMSAESRSALQAEIKYLQGIKNDEIT